jgi:hypothetical protein
MYLAALPVVIEREVFQLVTQIFSSDESEKSGEYPDELHFR